jgi:hypothetical protein
MIGRMAAFLAALSAVFFALAAALQQRGQFALARGGKGVKGVGQLVRLLAVPGQPRDGDAGHVGR